MFDNHSIINKRWIIWIIFLYYLFIFVVYLSWDKIYGDYFIKITSNLLSNANQEEEKFFSTSFKHCGGFGNAMFRGASIYGISKELNRMPYFNVDYKDLRNYVKELNETFPNFFNYIFLKKPKKDEIKTIDFGNKNVYENPLRLKNISHKWIEITARYPFSFKYFDTYNNHINNMFKFHTKIKETGRQFMTKLVGNDTSHKVCVYIRRGDFIKHGSLLESKIEFIVPAIEFVHTFLKSENSRLNISLIFKGTDSNFINSIKVDKNKFSAIYYPKPLSRAEDLYLGIRYCDSILLTTSISTFGYWMAYLKKSKGYVFYNSQQRKNIPHISDLNAFYWYPTDWIMLTQNKTTDKIYRDNWNYTQFLLDK